jgi:hypothetical protein
MWLAMGSTSKWHPIVETLEILEAHNFACKPLIEIRVKAKL